MISVCSLFLLFATGAFARGPYRRTEDGKTLVWNNGPRHSDSASWSGERDDEGYATGYGTLTWYTAFLKRETGSQLPIPKYIALTRYSGKMVRGKLNGKVSNVDGNGNAFHGKFVAGKKSGDWAPGPWPEADEPRSRRVSEGAATESPAAGPVAAEKAATEPPRPVATPQPVADQPPEQHVSNPEISETPSQKNSNLLQLARPPSSLGAHATSAAPDQTRAAGATSSPNGAPSLTTADVIGAAEAEARKQGYNLGEYQSGQAHYTATDGTWSIEYNQKDGQGNAEAAKHFSVRVEDKTKKASVVGGK
ncbi:MAG: hypothetical protein JWO45_1446 [Spartobacteria bacterium]|nr:hypothetical protein [Spartobacteria bacterium]